MIQKGDIQTAIRKECSQLKLDPLLLESIITVESAWNPWAARYEPKSSILVNTAYYAAKNIISLDTEVIMQKTSFGLAQIMGFNARDLGFAGHLPELYDPFLNMKLMALFFKKRCEPKESIEDKVSTYNQGSPRKDKMGKYVNQPYVDKVMKIYKGIK